MLTSSLSEYFVTRGKLPVYYSSTKHDLFQTLFSPAFIAPLRLSVCFFSPLTVAQLKTELLGSKFNSILEETTVRFLKIPIKKQRKLENASPARISASVHFAVRLQICLVFRCFIAKAH